MKCPNCYRNIISSKYAMVKCVCGRVLMIIEINKIKQIMDVTKEGN